jgi:exopolysaccharide biosynthesis predicted pyruvyltransferase EpsI
MSSRGPVAPPDVEASRRALVEAIPAGGDVAFVTGGGNVGDHLIWAGARRLLADIPHRHLGLEDLPTATGDVAVVTGGGGFCRAFHDEMPLALEIAERRFGRVVVLPSSFEVDEEPTRRVLSGTTATVFAREPVSLAAIVDLCDARLAHDCAFFFDFGPYRVDAPGDGVLKAFRTDAERRFGRQVPEDNEDLSAVADSLDAFLARIARVSEVHTDRAHVLIAAALLGRRARYAESNYHKVRAIAEWALAGYPVEPLEGGDPEPPARRPAPVGRTYAGVTTLLPIRDREPQALAGRDADLGRVLIVDRNSSPAFHARLNLDVLSLGHDPGAAGAIAEALPRVTTEHVLVLDPELVPEPGLLSTLLDALSAHPESIAATAEVRRPDGSVEHAGASVTVAGGVAEIAPAPPGQGTVDWAPFGATLWSTDALRRRCPDGSLGDFAWHELALRVQGSGPLLAVDAACAIRQPVPTAAPSSTLVDRHRRLLAAEAIAAVRRRHGVILVELFNQFPWMARDGRRDLASARLLLDLLEAKGYLWMLGLWYSGDIAPLFRGPPE